jgi:hypothetical protein
MKISILLFRYIIPIWIIGIFARIILFDLKLEANLMLAAGLGFTILLNQLHPKKPSFFVLHTVYASGVWSSAFLTTFMALMAMSKVDPERMTLPIGQALLAILLSTAVITPSILIFSHRFEKAQNENSLDKVRFRVMSGILVLTVVGLLRQFLQ